MNATAQSKLYGYVRVSTKEQNEDRQITALKNFGIADENIFMDKMSGKDFKRPQYHHGRKKACIVILDMPILDTRRQKDDLTSQLISTLVLQILSYVAQIERDFIKQRQSEGIAAAKARGIKFGREPISPPANFNEVYKLWKNLQISAREAGKRLNVSYKTFLKWTRQK